MTQDHLPEVRMEKALHDFFHGERASGLTLMIWGGIALVIAVFFIWKFEGNLFLGAAAPTGLIAMLHLTAGATVFLRSSKLAESLAANVRNLPEQFVNQEFKRMELVISNFEKYQTAGQILFFMGCGFVAGGAFFGGGDYMLGSGIGLCCQSAVTLVFDLFASFRGGLYLHELKVFKREM
jgi:hypothetical protein